MLIGLARVSTHEQSLALQVDALERAGCERVFTEEVSGARSERERPGLQEALAFARQGDILVVWRLDRLGRSLRHLIDTVEDLERRGIGLMSLQENIETQTPSGKLAFRMFAALSEWERDVLRSRTLAGLAAARERGRKGGRPLRMTESRVAMARGLLAEGRLTVAEVAAELGVAPSTLYRAVPAARSNQLGAPASRCGST